MIGPMKTGRLQAHGIDVAVSLEGQLTLTAQGRPAEVAVLNDAGAVVARGTVVAHTAAFATFKAYWLYLCGKPLADGGPPPLAPVDVVALLQLMEGRPPLESLGAVAALPGQWAVLGADDQVLASGLLVAEELEAHFANAMRARLIAQGPLMPDLPAAPTPKNYH